MSIHQTNTGQWFVAYRIKGDRQVRRKYCSHGPEGKLEAKKWEAEYLEQARRRPAPPPEGFPELTFRALAEKYLAARPLSFRSNQGIVYTLEGHVLPLWGHLNVSHLTMTHLNELDQSLISKGLSLATRNRYRSYCRAICQWGFDNDLVPSNPFAKFKADIRREGKAPDLVTEKELLALLAAAPPHLKWAIEVMMNTGVRPGVSELFALKMSDVDFARGGIWVTRTKTREKKPHLLPLRPEFLAKIRDVLAKDPGRRFLIEYDLEPVTSLKTAWNSTKKRAGITRRLRLYDLRHWFASNILARGADLKATSELLGHSSPATTLNTYYHILERQKREAINFLEIPSLDDPRPADEQSADES